MRWFISRSVRLCALLAMASWPVAAGAQDREWEESSSNYEDDAWYDVSEWFDGNDYNPTDERGGVWDDETYQGAVDSSDGDNDYNYSAYDQSDYSPYYDGVNSEYDYSDDNYYSDDSDTYDSYASDNSRNRNANTNTSTNSYHQDSDNGSTYDFSAFYYDLDGDGYYDSMRTYYDWDGDGAYDLSRLYVFNDAASNNNRSSANRQSQKSGSSASQAQQASSSRKQRVQGEVVSQRTTKVQGQEHLLVTLKKQDGNQKCFVDLGPKSDLKNLKISQGKQIKAEGPVVKAADRKILLAQEVEANGKSRNIDRMRKEFSGTIDELRTATVQGTEHELAVLSMDQGKQAIVDLGCKDRLNVDLQRDDQITVKGAPVKIDDQRVILAFEVQHDGEKTKIDRRSDAGMQQQQARHEGQTSKQNRARQQARTQSQTQEQSLTGEVQQTKTISVRGKQHHAATIETKNGQSVLVDFGPKSQSKIDLQKGDRLSVRGPMIRANDQRIVLATAVRQNGEQTSLRRAGENYSDAKQQSITGTVESTRTAQVRGQERQLAKVKTDQGQMVLIDLGPADELEADLSQGDKITARGAALKAGDQRVLVAFELETDNDGSVAISRDDSNTSRR